VVPALAAKMPDFISRWVSAHGCLGDDRVIFADIGRAEVSLGVGEFGASSAARGVPTIHQTSKAAPA